MTATSVPVPSAANDSLHEEWRPLSALGLPYEVSSLGRCRSLLSVDATTGEPYVLSPGRGAGGYLTNYLFTPAAGRCRSHKLHRLVCWAFHGPAPSKHHVCRHLNDNPADNRAANLAWGTREQNAEDARRNGGALLPRRRRTGRLQPAQVRAIRRRAAAGEAIADLAREYDIAYSVAHRIARGLLYRYVHEDAVADARAAVIEEQSRRQAREAHRAARELAEIEARERARPPQGQRRKAA